MALSRRVSRILAALVLLQATSSLLAQTPPANKWLEGYANYAELEAQLANLAKTPGVQLESLALSPGGRKVHLLTIALGEGSAAARPAMLLVGGASGSHVVGSDIALRTAKLLVEQAATDPKTRTFLERTTLYIVPRLNPDGVEKNFARSPVFERQGNDRATDDDRDFAPASDPPNDLNGDGLITMMRVADSSGRWRPHADDSRALIEIDPKKNERGQFRVYVEGLDDDLDGEFNEDAGDGVSINRNFAFKHPYLELAAGAVPHSEAETRGLADFAFDHPNIALVFALGPEENLFHPWKPAQDQGRIVTSILGADAPYQTFLAERFQKTHGGKDAPGSPAGAGACGDWAYFHYGRWSLATRCWWPPKITLNDEAKKKLSGDNRGEDDLNLLRWLDREKLDGFVPWKEVAHAQFPGRTVEVGGFKPLVRWNPPAAELDPLAKKQAEYLTGLGELLPRLELQPVKVDALGGGVFRLKITLVNQGYLPTMAEMGKTTGEAHAVQMKLTLPEGAALLQGASRRALPRLEGHGGEHETTWLVRTTATGAAKVGVRAWAPAVGEATTEVELKSP